MDIRILQLIEGAKMAEGITVVIDVFRAFSLESYMMAQGAKTVIPVGDAELAYRLKRENPDMILAGERDGKIMPGFDLGNSPTDLQNGIDVTGKTVIHTTSAGTQGIANAVNASKILCGALVNARATAEYIRSLNPEKVSLVCMGLAAKEPTEEDTLCAEYIKSILLGSTIDLEAGIENLKVTSVAKFFDKTQNDVFPEMDFHYCTQVDKFDFALEVETDAQGLSRVVKRDMG
jgi:2-phosphosulfolactate phosphatase